MSGVKFGCIVPHPPIMVPEVGCGREVEVEASITAMNALAKDLAAERPDTVFFISPHGPMMSSAMGVCTSSRAAGDLNYFGAPQVAFRFPNDLDAVRIIQQEALATGISVRSIGGSTYSYDHGLCVPLYFLAEAMAGAALVPLTFSLLSLRTHFDFGGVLRRTAERLGKRVAIVASGDLSHRLLPDSPAGYDPVGREFDRQVCAAVAAFDSKALLSLDEELIYRAGECGLRSLTILFGALHSLPVRPTVLSYEGPFGVGYLVAAMAVEAAAEELRAAEGRALAEHPLVQLARRAVESYVRERVVIGPPLGINLAVQGPAGVFVTIRCHGSLRGCIGTIEPATPDVSSETIANAIGSACRDPRFLPVTADDLGDLTYEVSVLGDPEPASAGDLSPGTYGVIVQKGRRRGLLLPDIEGVDTVEQQIAIARAKAGIRTHEDGVSLQRFEVRKYT